MSVKKVFTTEDCLKCLIKNLLLWGKGLLLESLIGTRFLLGFPIKDFLKAIKHGRLCQGNKPYGSEGKRFLLFYEVTRARLLLALKTKDLGLLS